MAIIQKGISAIAIYESLNAALSPTQRDIIEKPVFPPAFGMFYHSLRGFPSIC